jgi:hypothetical protein
LNNKADRNENGHRKQSSWFDYSETHFTFPKNFACIPGSQKEASPELTLGNTGAPSAARPVADKSSKWPCDALFSGFPH